VPQDPIAVRQSRVAQLENGPSIEAHGPALWASMVPNDSTIPAIHCW